MDRSTILRCKLILLTVGLSQTISISCKVGNTANDPRIPPSVSPNSSSDLPKQAQSPPQQGKPSLSSIRDVDFKNTTYPWYPSYLNAPDNRRELKLQNGAFEIKENEHIGMKNLHVELENVTYADMSGRGQEESIVTLGGVSVFNRFVGAVFIYTIENGKLMLIWQQETGDRADGGLRRIGLVGRTMVIEKYVRSEGDGGLCCPRKFMRSSYELSGQQLKKVKSELLPSEYDYAKFLGYPGESAR